MSRVLLVGKGAPDRGGIPSFLNDLHSGELSRLHELTFLNVAHHGTPEGGDVSAGNVLRTLKDAAAVWRSAKGHDVVPLSGPPHGCCVLQRAQDISGRHVTTLGRAMVGDIEKRQLVQAGKLTGVQVVEEARDASTVRGTLSDQQHAAHDRSPKTFRKESERRT